MLEMRLGEMLLERKLITTAEDLEKALERKKSAAGDKLGTTLWILGFTSPCATFGGRLVRTSRVGMPLVSI